MIMHMVVSAVEYDELCGVSVTNDVQGTSETRSKKPRSKSVHFADSKGLALTSIFLFASPKDNLSPPCRRRTIACLKDIKRSDLGKPAKLLNFRSPVSYTEVLERVQTLNVCLEMIVCDTFGICGRIHVKNLAFVKEVSVRYTFDAWQTFRDQPANYIRCSSTKERDLFFFEIKPPQISENTTKMRFAICYRVCDMEFWDNNHGDDYRLVYYKTKDTMSTDLSLTELADRNI